jgi:hypothetical protein
MRSTLRLSPFALAAVAALSACTETAADPPRDAAVVTDAQAHDVGDLGTLVVDSGPLPDDDAGSAAALPEGDCDPIDPSACALPWPSNLYLRRDAARRTGYSLTFGPTSLPANGAGDPMDPRPLRRFDGYGLGSPIMTSFPNLDLAAMATEEHQDRSMAADAAALLYEVQGNTLQRIPYFVELDGQEPMVARKILFLRPLVILKENTRYVVAFRNLRTTAGAAIEPSAAFARLRAGTTAGDPALGPRQARFDEVFTLLQGAGVDRSSLTLAWDFQTASSESLHGRLLAMRDDALMRVGPSGPRLAVDNVTTFLPMRDGSGRPYDEDIAIELSGTFEVPHYLHPRRLGSQPGWEMNYDASGRPVANGTRQPRFWIRIPHSALRGEPHGLVMYGHGLLGSAEEVGAGYNGHIANTHNLIFFAANLTGMSEEDLSGVFATLRDASYFTSVGERLHQGMVEWVLLARAMREQIAGLAEVASRNIRINQSELYYSGISQGGIFGGTFVAVSPDVTRGHLGVPGNNYFTLLHRSRDFTGYFEGLRRNYPSTVDQAIGLAYVQLLWDGTDPVSYLRHIHQEPFPGNSPHEVLLAPAKGDFEVAVFTNEITARSGLGVALMQNYDSQRTPFGITQEPFPRRGSGVVLYDFGNPWPPPGNVPPPEVGTNPHGLPRSREWHQRQMVTFFRTGEIIDTCGGDGCRPD